MDNDFAKATLKKTTVSTLPLWADRDFNSLTHNLSEEASTQDHVSSSGSSSAPQDDNQNKTPGISLPLHGSTTKAHYHGSSTLSNLSNISAPSASSAAGDLSHANSTVSGPRTKLGSGSARSIPGTGACTTTKSTNPNPIRQSHRATPSQQAEWSVFATMSNVSSSLTPSQQQHFRNPSSSSYISSTISSPTFPTPAAQPFSTLKRLPQKLDELFKTKPGTQSFSMSTSNGDRGEGSSVCTCTCPQHRHSRSSSGGTGGGRFGFGLGLSTSKRRNRKESMEIMRGYPTGQCISSNDPPPETSWDEKESNDLSATATTKGQHRFFAKNTAFNIEALKMFLNSPLFSNILKSMTVMAAVSLFAIALDAIVILLKTPDQQTQLSNDNAALIIIVILSILTILYSCFTIFLESRRPPEGLDSSNSKPLIVIFSEIVASIIWAQVLSVTIYIYIWTYGCTDAGKRELDKHWKLQVADEHLTDRMCRRQGAMVGLELLLVLLLIFNFYTHLEINYRFARSMR